MTLLDATSTVIDAARQLPANKHLDAAIKRLEQRLDVLRARLARRLEAKAKRAAGLPANCPRCRCLFVVEPPIGALVCPACNYLACPLCGSTHLGVLGALQGGVLQCGDCFWKSPGRAPLSLATVSNAPPGAGLLKGADTKKIRQ